MSREQRVESSFLLVTRHLKAMLTLLFVLFGAMAIGCALGVVAQRNPLYSAISLIGVFVSLACLYMTLQAPFIAAVQVIVYAGAIMVLVVFVIMLLNVEEEVRRPVRLHFLIPVGLLLAAALILGEVQRRLFVPLEVTNGGLREGVLLAAAERAAA